MIHYLGHRVYTVDEKTLKTRNRNKSWTYGYDPEFDIVIISKDGTIGEIYEISDIKIALPKPPRKKTLKNGNYEKKFQKWRREELPLGLNADNWESQHLEWVTQQDVYRKQGFWTMINGNYTYMTGTYWFFLQWVRIEEDYPNFRQIQNEYMIFWEACKADKRCYGLIYGKNRRMGATSLAVADELLSGIIYREKKIGLVSKTGEDSKDVFNRLVTAFKRLPPFFKPNVDGTSTPKTELILREPTKKLKQGERVSSETGMNTSIKWFNTALNAMDGMRVFRALIDEASKFPKDVPFDKYWNIVKTSLRKGKVIFGKAMVVSTVNAMNKGGEEFKKVYYNSKKKNKNNQTLSGLYPIYIPAQYCLEGFFDEFGFSIVEDPLEPIKTDVGDYETIGAKTSLQNELDALKDSPDEYNEQLRQFPMQESDMFRDSSSDCFFNVLKLEEQVAYNTEELDDDKYGNHEIIRGNFTWANGVKDSRAIWHPDPENGRFWIAKGCIPPLEYQNKKYLTTRHGITAFAPGNENLGCIGIDPFNRSKTSDGRGSDGAMHLCTRLNTLGFPNDNFIMEYIARPKKIEIFYEDVILAMCFFSIPILPELSSERFSHTLIERGYRWFVKNNPYKKWHELSAEERKCGGVNAQNSKFREEQFQALNSHIEDHVGVARDSKHRPMGEMGFMPFTRTLQQWKKADPDKRTDWDAYISSSNAKIGCLAPVKAKIDKPKPIKLPFKQYDNSGTISKAI